MKTAIQQLSEWIDEFTEVASYHHGEYKQGMIRVLDGARSQLNSLKQIEKDQIKRAFNVGGTEAYEQSSDDYYNETFNQ